jgi:hypothetical protein
LAEGSTPSPPNLEDRRIAFGPLVYRFRTSAPQAGEAGSIPARAAHHHLFGRIVQSPGGGMADARVSEARARRAWEFESPLGDLISGFEVVDDFPGVTGVSSALIRSARPVRSRGLGLAGGPALGRVSYARFRWFNSPTRNGQSRPVLTTARYAKGIAARLRVWCLWVRIPPVLLDSIRLDSTRCNGQERPVVQWRRHLSHTEEMGVRLPPGRFDSIRLMAMVRRCSGGTPPR